MIVPAVMVDNLGEEVGSVLVSQPVQPIENPSTIERGSLHHDEPGLDKSDNNDDKVSIHEG